MQQRIEASYFDGQTSTPHAVVIGFDEAARGLEFSLASGQWWQWEVAELQVEWYGSVLEIRHRQDRTAFIKVADEAFAKRLYAWMQQHSHIDLHTRILQWGFSKIAGIALLLLALIVAFYFFLLPPLAERAAALLPESFDNQLGDVFMRTFVKESKIDEKKTAQLQAFAAELDLGNSKELRFLVVESSMVNAFALPNGQIVIFTGILEQMEGPEALVALLGHEAAHVNNRHSVKMLSRNLAGYFAISLLFSDVNGMMAVLADNAHQLHSLSFSRKFEEQADADGLEIMLQNKVDPQGMVALFEQLEAESYLEVPEILSTHPITKERKKRVQQFIESSEVDVKANPKLQKLFKQLKR